MKSVTIRSKEGLTLLSLVEPEGVTLDNVRITVAAVNPISVSAEWEENGARVASHGQA